MNDEADYPRFVRVHESHVVRHKKKPDENFALVDRTVEPREHVTAGPDFPKFYVHPDGAVDVAVHDAEEEAKATSPNEEDHKSDDEG